MSRLFRKLATPCQYIPANGAPFERLVSVGNNRREASSQAEYIAEPVLLACFLKAEGPVAAGDMFELNGETHQLTQMFLVDDFSVEWVYI